MWPLFFHRACASHRSTAPMLKIRAQYVPCNLRQPPQALESTPEKGAHGRPWTSTLTEPVQLEPYSKNWKGVSEGSSQVHACRWAGPQCGSLCVNGADLGAKGPAGPWNNRRSETTTARACSDHGKTFFCVVWCRTAPSYSAAEIAGPLKLARCVPVVWSQI